MFARECIGCFEMIEPEDKHYIHYEDASDDNGTIFLCEECHEEARKKSKDRVVMIHEFYLESFMDKEEYEENFK